MAGHSQFKNIMYRKGAQDKKRAKIFARHIRELTVAARMNPDPDGNPRLRSAIAAARRDNMPKDNIERALKRASGGDDGTQYDETRYEGYGPAGVAVIVETLTDNRNRTVGEVRSAFSKYGGSLGETGSVSFGFDRVGSIQYDATAASADEAFEAALEAGADDCMSDDGGHEILCQVEAFHEVREALEQSFGPARSAELIWRPQNTIPVDRDKAETLFKLLDVLEDLDDVQRVFANFDVSDDVMQQLSA